MYGRAQLFSKSVLAGSTPDRADHLTVYRRLLDSANKRPIGDLVGGRFAPWHVDKPPDATGGARRAPFRPGPLVRDSQAVSCSLPR
jgi:hypothetical protein